MRLLATAFSQSSAAAAAPAPASSPTALRRPVAAEAIAKPSWQTGTGVPADGVRDTPDVSLFASAGFFGAFYVVCQQSTNSDGQPCSLAAPAYDFAGYGGTSVSAPAFAGILSLVNQKTGSRQGNANYVLYNLASQQNKAGTACNSITGTPAAGCVFNDVTTGTIAMPCLKGTPNCTVTTSTDRYGVLSGYASTAGYDLATGLGSVNAANLVNSWSNASFIASATTLTLSPPTITHGSQVSASVRVASTTGTPTGNVSINALASNGSVQNGTLQNGSYTGSLGNFPGGAYSVQAHYAGDGTYAPSDSNSVTLTVSPESSTTTLRGAALQSIQRHHHGHRQRRELSLRRLLPSQRPGCRRLRAGNCHRQRHPHRLRRSDRRRNLPPQLHLQHRRSDPLASPRHPRHHRRLLRRCQLQRQHLVHRSPSTSPRPRPPASCRSIFPFSLPRELYVLTAQISARGYGANQTAGLRRFRSVRHRYIQLRRHRSWAPRPSRRKPTRLPLPTISCGHLHASRQPAAGRRQRRHRQLCGRRKLRPSTSMPSRVTVTGSTQAASTHGPQPLVGHGIAPGDSYTFTAAVFRRSHTRCLPAPSPSPVTASSSAAP